MQWQVNSNATRFRPSRRLLKCIIKRASKSKDYRTQFLDAKHRKVEPETPSRFLYKGATNDSEVEFSTSPAASIPLCDWLANLDKSDKRRHKDFLYENLASTFMENDINTLGELLTYTRDELVQLDSSSIKSGTAQRLLKWADVDIKAE